MSHHINGKSKSIALPWQDCFWAWTTELLWFKWKEIKQTMRSKMMKWDYRFKAMCQTQANAKNSSLNGSIERKIAEHNLSIGSVFAFDLFCELAFVSLSNVLLLIEAQSIQAIGTHSANCGRTRTSARKPTTTSNRTNRSKLNNSIQSIWQ